MMRTERLKSFNTKKKKTTKNYTAIDDMDILKYINNLDDFRRKKIPPFLLNSTPPPHQLYPDI